MIVVKTVEGQYASVKGLKEMELGVILMSIQISWNIDIDRELRRNPFCRIARISQGDGINLRTVTTTVFPSYHFTDESVARETAEKHDVECVRIIMAQEWNGEISFKFIGWGLFDAEEDLLLETIDFEWV